MHGDGDDQEHQHRGVGERPERDAVEQGGYRQHDRAGERDAEPHRQLVPGRQPDQERRYDRQQAVKHHRLGEAPRLAVTNERVGFRRRRHRGEDEHQPHRAGQLLHLQRGKRERGVADHVAERHEDDARDQEDQDDPEADQDVDGAGGDAVLNQKKRDFRRHGEGIRAGVR